MHAVVTNWRLKAATQDPDAYRLFVSESARIIAPILRANGMLDVFLIRTAPDVVKFVNIYDNDIHAESALHSVAAQMGTYLAKHLELIERTSGDAIDLIAMIDAAESIP